MAIPKNQSISFNEYIENIGNTPPILASDWGFFVPLETNKCNMSNKQIINIDINDITETMFEMDCPTDPIAPIKSNIISNIYTNIKDNLFVVSSFIIYKVGSVCLQ